MLNYIWLGLIALAVLIGGFRGNTAAVTTAAIDSANKAVTLAIGLLAVMTLWLGLMRLADKAGLVHRLGRALRPILKWLFPEVPADHPAMGAIVLNMAANILGLNNAATPLGLRAMGQLERLNPRPGVATNAMCMLMAINTSSITLIPVTVIGLLTVAHAKNPSGIIGTALAASIVAHLAAIATCKLLERTPLYRLPPLPMTATPKTLDAQQHASAADIRDEGQVIEEQSMHDDQALPWVPQAGRILAAVAGLFIAMFLVTAFPEIIGPPRPGAILASLHDRMNSAGTFLSMQPGAALLLAARRLLDAISVLAIPWLILFFPLYAALRRLPVYEEFVEGAKEAAGVILRILPYLVGMLVAVGMFNAAGGLDLITRLLSPVTNLLGFPPQLVALAAIRPFSYAAAFSLLQTVVDHAGPDSFLALAAGTMYGCSETTFYVLAVYFGSVGVRKTRHALPAGVVADIVGPLASVAICRLVYG